MSLDFFDLQPLFCVPKKFVRTNMGINYEIAILNILGINYQTIYIYIYKKRKDRHQYLPFRS